MVTLEYLRVTKPAQQRLMSLISAMLPLLQLPGQGRAHDRQLVGAQETIPFNDR